MSVQIYIEGQRLDLYDKDNITVKSIVNDINDLSLKVDFSQSFSVPASDRNNTIFSDYYNVDIDNGFDARIRKLATIDIDTLDFKQGKIQLTEVKVKNHRPESYKITFYGDAIKLKDLIGDDELSVLTWLDNFDHDYTDTNVQTGLTTGLDFTVDSVTYTKAIIYPMVSYQRQWLYNSDSSDVTSTDDLVNIAYDAGRTDGVDYRNLKPAINLPVIMKAIEEKYSLEFTGNFFDTEEYKQVYMNLSNDKSILENGILVVEEVSGTQPLISPTNDRYLYQATITPDAGFENTPYRFRLTVNDIVAYESSIDLTGTQNKQGSLVQFSEDYTVKCEVITSVDFEFAANTRLEYKYNNQSPSNTVTVFANAYTGLVIDLTTVVIKQFQEIKVFDFIESIIKMSNLIVTPTNDGSLYFNDLQNWYSEGQIYDITPYVDTRKTDVKRGKIFNQINFLFEESDQILAAFYRDENNIGYGDIEAKLYENADGTGELLDGEKFETKVIFENPIFERLTDLNAGDISIQYCLMLNQDLAEYVGSPFLFYAPSVSVAANSIGFLGSSGSIGYTEIATSVLMPSHSMQIDTESFNLNFDAVINEYTSQIFFDTIYKRFYEDFFSDVFSIKRRTFLFDSILPLNLLHRLKMNDRLIIRDRRYLINSVDSNIVNRSDRLELLNDIYDAPLPSDQLNTSVFRNTFQIFNSGEHNFTANYIGLDDQSASRVDLGDGITWVTLTSPKSVGVTSEIGFTIAENLTGAERVMNIQVVDGLNDPVFTVIQKGQAAATLNFSNPLNALLMNTILTGKS